MTSQTIKLKISNKILLKLLLGAIRGSSKEKLYQELGFEYLIEEDG